MISATYVLVYIGTRHIKHYQTAKTPLSHLISDLAPSAPDRITPSPTPFLSLSVTLYCYSSSTVLGSCVVLPEGSSFYLLVAVVVVIVSSSRALMAYRGEPVFFFAWRVIHDRPSRCPTRKPALSSNSGSAQLVPVGNQQAIACLYFCASRPIMACDCGNRSWSKVIGEVLIGEAGDADGEEGVALALCI